MIVLLRASSTAIAAMVCNTPDATPRKMLPAGEELRTALGCVALRSFVDRDERHPNHAAEERERPQRCRRQERVASAQAQAVPALANLLLAELNAALGYTHVSHVDQICS